jgi:hypothetical protein
MRNPAKLWPLAGLILVLIATSARSRQTTEREMIPPQFPKEQQENLLRFLEQHSKPDRYIPPEAKMIGNRPPGQKLNVEVPPGKSIKQYTVQIVSHRPVPGQEDVKRADVYYYRPNPEKGKPGIAVKYTVDLTTGNQVGQTEVLLNSHTPISREELDEAVALAKEKSPAVQDVYKGRDKNTVHWEYLQIFVNRKHENVERGDRVVRLVFTAAVPEDQSPPTPVRVIVDLTKGTVQPETPGVKGKG